MTKLLTVRVVLAVDDEIDLKELKPRLQAIIADKGTERINEQSRIHWSTADVLQGPAERPGAVARRGGRKTNSGTSSAPLTEPALPELQ